MWYVTYKTTWPLWYRGDLQNWYGSVQGHRVQRLLFKWFQISDFQIKNRFKKPKQRKTHTTVPLHRQKTARQNWRQTDSSTNKRTWHENVAIDKKYFNLTSLVTKKLTSREELRGINQYLVKYIMKGLYLILQWARLVTNKLQTCIEHE